MMDRRSTVKSKWYTILRGFLAISVLGVNLLMIKRLFADIPDDAELEEAVKINFAFVREAAVALFIVLIIFHLVQCIGSFRESRLLTASHLVYVFLSGLAAVLMVLKGDGPEIWPVACFMYMLAFFISRILMLILRRSKWNVFLLIVSILLLVADAAALVFMAYVTPEMQAIGVIYVVVILFLLIDVQVVAMIMPMAFSQIRLDVLKKIIRKSYAVEILSGIILLIVAFSLILPAFETGIDDFGDALWYCFAIVTTIGFGDMYATSLIGRIMSVILGLYGIIVVALITSIIVNFYGEMKKEGDADEDEDPEKLPEDKEYRYVRTEDRSGSRYTPD